MRILFVSLLCCLLISPALAEESLPRHYYGARIEPPTGVMHGAGQTYSSEPLNSAFERYGQLLGTDHYPLVFMAYNSVSTGQSTYTALKTRLDTLESETGRYVIPQFGLYFQSGGLPEGYDLSKLCNGLKSLGRPCFLRIGYEFNGTWYDPDYQPATFIDGFRRIVTALREAGVPAASVWNPYPGWNAYYGSWSYIEPFYPGDEYVDWWGMDLFSPGDFLASGSSPADYQLTAAVSDFLAAAHEHRKPVLIGEATARFVGADNPTDWDAWFAPFFWMIHTQPGIKGHTYINWDWSSTAEWPTWGNCALDLETTDPTVRDNYLAEMANDSYIHAATACPAWATVETASPVCMFSLR